MHRKNHLQHLSEVRLNEDHVLDVWDVFEKIPSIMISHDMFISMVLNCPPEISLTSLKWEMTNDLLFLLRTYWMPHHQKVYTWFKAIGVCPWYWEQVRGTEHKIPVVPPRNAGYITTYLDTNHKQRFNYYWKDATTMEPDKKMYFEVSRHPPGLDGSIRSPISSLLYEWRTTRIVRISTEIATDQQVHQQHVFEFHPAKGNQGDDNLATLEAFGDKIAGTVMARQEGLYSTKTSIRASDLQHSLATAAAANRGMRAKFGGHVLYSESHGEKWERENANVIERGIPLKPDFSYKPVPAPRVTTDLVGLSLRLEKMASAVMDIPFQMIESTGGRSTANVQGNLRFVNERIRDWTNVFEEMTKRMFLMAYGEVVQRGLDKQRPDKLLQLYADTEVTVRMPCTPIASLSDITAMHMAGYMKKQTAAEHAFTILGLSHDDISISEYPDQVPPELATAPPRLRKKPKTDITADVSAV